MSQHGDNPSHEDRDRDGYDFEVGDENLAFRPVTIDDPVVTGRQILRLAGAWPVEDHVAIALLGDGALETLRLDETFDLRGRGVEQVLVFRTDRLFRFFINGQDEEWGASRITGRALKGLAKVDPATHDVFLEVPGGADIAVGDTELFDLARPGVERFVTVEKPRGHGRVRITVVVNGQPTEVVAEADDLLSSVRDRALQRTENVGQPPENWELKTKDGAVLDLAAPVGTLGFGDEVTLYLSLKAGVAGA